MLSAYSITAVFVVQNIGEGWIMECGWDGKLRTSIYIGGEKQRRGIRHGLRGCFVDIRSIDEYSSTRSERVNF